MTDLNIPVQSCNSFSEVNRNRAYISLDLKYSKNSFKKGTSL